MAASVRANAPRIVDRYVMYDAIASGGMATVHLGRLIGAGGFSRPVAIKQLHEQFAREPDFVEMFLDEARLTYRIAHPNVVSILDAVVSEGEVFIVMEYIRGASLARLLRSTDRRREPLRLPIATAIVSGMLHGLQAAHEARDDRGQPLDLIHRDVSPQNVLVGTDGVPRLVDFGVAKASGRLHTTRQGQLKGKLAYMAPEQAGGDPLTRATDVYAASVVLWETVTGKRLFHAENEATVLARVLAAEVPVPSSIVPGLSHAFDCVVMRGLQRDPAKRYATAREMALDLALAGEMAAPSEIGEWVGQAAANELRVQAALVGRVERASYRTKGESLAAGVLEFAIDQKGFRGARARGAGACSWEQETRREGRSEDTSGSPMASSLPIATGWSKKGGKGRLVLASVAFLSLLAAAAGFLALGHHPRERPASVAQPTARDDRTQSDAGKGAASSRPTAVDAPLAVTDLPAFEEASPTYPAADTVVIAPKPHSAARAASAASRPEPNRAPSQAPASAQCDPPFTTDAKGHVHFKLECVE